MKKTISKVAKAKAENQLIKFFQISIVFFTIALYANSLGNQFAFDDSSVITENFIVKKGVEGIPDLFKTSYRFGYWNEPGTLYRPLSLVMFAIEYEIAPDSAFLGHFFNLLFYLFSALVLFKVLRLIFQSVGSMIPFLITLFFVVHPIHTEVVANIKSRDEIMAFFFGLISIYYFIRYLDNKKSFALIGSLLSYFVGFLFKENLITFLAVFPLIAYYKNSAITSKEWIISALYIIPSGFYLLLRYMVLEDINTISNLSIIENVLAGAPDKASYYATVFYLLGKYVWMSIIPFPLSSDYSFPQIDIVSWANPYVWVSLIIHLLLGGYAIYGLKKRHPEAFGIAFYLITFSIVSNLVITIGASFGERFLYVPVLGIIIAFVFLFSRLLKRNGSEIISRDILFKRLKTNSLITGVVAVLILLSSWITIDRNADWKDDFTLYKADVITCPNSSRLHYFYGLELLQTKSRSEADPSKKEMYLDSAIAEYQRALDLFPEYSGVYERLAYAMVLKEDREQALKYYEKSLELNPGNSIAINNMGQIYFDLKNYSKAEELYRKAIKFNPKFADAYFNLGSTLGSQGKFAESVQAFNNCLKFDPQNATAYYYAGISLNNMGRVAEAQKYLNQSAKLDPKFKSN